MFDLLKNIPLKIKKITAGASAAAFLLFASGGGSFVSAETGAVLFDNAHLESIGNANWTITGGFSDFADTIKGMGYKVEEIKNGKVTLDLLKKYDVFVVGEPNVKFDDSEEQAIVQYVREGGNLFMIADHAGADRNNDGWDAVKIFNNFSEPFGMKFAEKWVKKEMPIKGKVEQTDLTYKVKFCGTWGGTTVDILNPAIAKGHVFLSEFNGAGAYLATSEFEKGRVVALGDSSPFDDGTGDKGAVDLVDGYNLLNADHRQMAINSMCYLLRKDAREYPIKLKFFYAESKPSADPGVQKDFDITVINQDKKDYSNVTIDFYRNRPFDAKTKFYSTTVEKIAAGEKVQVKMPFKQNDRMMFTLYTCVNCASDNTANIVGFNSVMVGTPIMGIIDSVHENDYVNRVKMLKNAFEEDGLFYQRSKQPFSDEALGRVDVVVMTAPKAGQTIAQEEILALMNHLKKGRGMMFCGKGPDSNWGDNANLNNLMKGLGIPASFETHPEFKGNGGKAVSYELKENNFIKFDEIKTINGESPATVVIDEKALKAAGFTYQVISTLPGSNVPVDVIIDGSKSNTGFGKIAVFGSFHMSDQSYGQDLFSDTHKFNMKVMRFIAPPNNAAAFASKPQGNATNNNSGNNGNAAPSDNAKQTFVRGIAKGYANGVLFIEDFGVSKEIKIMHGLSEEKALMEFSKMKGKLVKVYLNPDSTELMTGPFDKIEYRK